jgi:hypothetical protein
MINALLVGMDGLPMAELVLPYVEAFARAANPPVTLVRAIMPERAVAPPRFRSSRVPSWELLPVIYSN